MSVKFTLDQTVNDFKRTLHNDFVMDNIVSQLVGKVNESKIITPQNKSKMSQYFNFNGSTQKKPFRNDLSTFKQNGGSGLSVKNILIATVIYYLVDLNNYDHHLINYAFNYGIGANNIIVLLLINNIFDIDIFCKKFNIVGSNYNTITTLKKLSALHKIQYNFN